MKDINILVCSLGNVSYLSATYDFMHGSTNSFGSSSITADPGSSNESSADFCFSGSAVMAELIRQKCRPNIAVFIGTMQSNWRCTGSYLKYGFRNSDQKSVIPDSALFSEDLKLAEIEAQKYFPENSSTEAELQKLADAINGELAGKLAVKFVVIPRYMITEQDKATFIRKIREQVIDETEGCRLRFHIDMSNGLRFLPILTFLSLECLKILGGSRISIKNIFCSEIVEPARKIYAKDRYTLKLRSLCNCAKHDDVSRSRLSSIEDLVRTLDDLAAKMPPRKSRPVAFKMRNLFLCDELFKKTEKLGTFRYSGELSCLYPLLKYTEGCKFADNGLFCESLGFYGRARKEFSKFKKAIAGEQADLVNLISERLSWCSGGDFDLKKLVKMYCGVNDYLHASLTMVRILENSEDQERTSKIKKALNSVNHLNSSERDSSNFLNSIRECISDLVPDDVVQHSGNVLISFVGRDSYDLMQYRMQLDDGREILLEPMKFAGAGLASHLSDSNSLKRLVLVGTGSSAWYLAAESLKECFKNVSVQFQEVLDILASYGDIGQSGAVSELPPEDQDIINELGKSIAGELGFEFQVVLMNDLLENTELIADKISEKIPENSNVLLDITHCFRYVPIIFSSVIFMLSFLRKNVRLKEIWYGDMGEPHPVMRLSSNRLFQNEKELEKLIDQEDRQRATEVLGRIREILDYVPEDEGFLSGDLRSLSAVSGVLYDALDIAKFKETGDLICLERILRNDFADRPELAEYASQSSLYENLCCFREAYETGRDVIEFFVNAENEKHRLPFVRGLHRELGFYFRNIEKNRFFGERTVFCIEKAWSALTCGGHRELVRAIFFLYEAFKSIPEKLMNVSQMCCSYNDSGARIRKWYIDKVPDLVYEGNGLKEHFYDLISLLRNGREHSIVRKDMTEIESKIAAAGYETFLESFIDECISAVEKLARDFGVLDD